MKVWLCYWTGSYDSDSELVKVVDSEEKANIWLQRQKEIERLWEQYHKDGTVARFQEKNPGLSSYAVPECNALIEELGFDFTLQGNPAIWEFEIQ